MTRLVWERRWCSSPRFDRRRGTAGPQTFVQIFMTIYRFLAIFTMSITAAVGLATQPYPISSDSPTLSPVWAWRAARPRQMLGRHPRG